MAATWQASGTLLGSVTDSVTPVIPTHQANDILICLTANRDESATCATPSGWTLGGGPLDEAGANIWRSYWFWKRATSSSETDPLCDWSNTFTDIYAQVHTVRGAITSGNFFSASAFSSDATDPLTHTGVTTTTANQRVLLLVLGNDDQPTTVTVTATDPAAFTLHNYQDITTGADAEGHAASAVRTSAGATGNIISDYDAAMPCGCGLVLALKDAVAAALQPVVIVVGL